MERSQHPKPLCILNPIQIREIILLRLQAASIINSVNHFPDYASMMFTPDIPESECSVLHMGAFIFSSRPPAPAYDSSAYTSSRSSVKKTPRTPKNGRTPKDGRTPKNGRTPKTVRTPKNDRTPKTVRSRALIHPQAPTSSVPVDHVLLAQAAREPSGHWYPFTVVHRFPGPQTAPAATPQTAPATTPQAAPATTPQTAPATTPRHIATSTPAPSSPATPHFPRVRRQLFKDNNIPPAPSPQPPPPPPAPATHLDTASQQLSQHMSQQHMPRTVHDRVARQSANYLIDWLMRKVLGLHRNAVMHCAPWEFVLPIHRSIDGVDWMVGKTFVLPSRYRPGVVEEVEEYVGEADGIVYDREIVRRLRWWSKEEIVALVEEGKGETFGVFWEAILKAFDWRGGEQSTRTFGDSVRLGPFGRTGL